MPGFVGYTPTAAQQKVGWDYKLQVASRPKDILGSSKRGIYRDGGVVADSYIIKKTATNGEMTCTMNMLRDLQGSGQLGANGLLGKEEQFTTFEYQVFADELKHGVPTENYGYLAHKASIFDMYAKAQPQLSEWYSKKEGARIRSAFCEGVDFVIVGGAQSPGATRAYPHSNIFVVQGNSVAKPAFSPTIATYAANVNAEVATIAHPTELTFLDELIEKLQGVDLPIKGVTGEDGETRYLLLVPQKTMTKIYGILYTYFKNSGAKDGMLMKGGAIYRCLTIVEDVLAPRCTVTGSALTFSYHHPGASRAIAESTTPDVGIVVGAGSQVEYVMEEVHFENEVQDYNQKKGVGIFSTKGYNRVDWEPNVTTAALSASRRNETSALVFFKSN